MIFPAGPRAGAGLGVAAGAGDPVGVDAGDPGFDDAPGDGDGPPGAGDAPPGNGVAAPGGSGVGDAPGPPGALGPVEPFCRAGRELFPPLHAANAANAITSTNDRKLRMVPQLPTLD
ncbi:MAG: hypothetical protein NVS3B28_09090 [Candidatus Velthaea sp.]